MTTFKSQLDSNPLRQQLEAAADSILGIHHDSPIMTAEITDGRQHDTTPLAYIHTQCDKRDASNDSSKHARLKADKARRVAIYRKQVADSGEIVAYQAVNERRLYANQQSFCTYAIGAGVMEEIDE